MNKQEAINAMLNGAKVTHRFFLPEEFIYMESGLIYNEINTLIGETWEWKLIQHWDEDWSIYRGESE